MYLVFYRENDKFKDILEDPVIKKAIRMKMSFYQHLILGFDNDKNTSYAMLKFGDDVTSMSHIAADRSPIAGKDYVPVRTLRGKRLRAVSS